MWSSWGNSSSIYPRYVTDLFIYSVRDVWIKKGFGFFRSLGWTLGLRSDSERPSRSMNPGHNPNRPPSRGFRTIRCIARPTLGLKLFIFSIWVILFCFYGVGLWGRQPTCQIHNQTFPLKPPKSLCVPFQSLQGIPGHPKNKRLYKSFWSPLWAQRILMGFEPITPAVI